MNTAQRSALPTEALPETPCGNAARPQKIHKKGFLCIKYHTTCQI